MNGFEKWWNAEGSAMRPTMSEDVEEFAKRITRIAWCNGAYKATVFFARKAADTLVDIEREATKQ